MVPVTKAVDSPEGTCRVPLCKGVPSFKGVLLALEACEYCQEATSDGSTCCHACDIIYGDYEYDPVYDEGDLPEPFLPLRERV